MLDTAATKAGSEQLLLQVMRSLPCLWLTVVWFGCS